MHDDQARPDGAQRLEPRPLHGARRGLARHDDQRSPAGPGPGGGESREQRREGLVVERRVHDRVRPSGRDGARHVRRCPPRRVVEPEPQVDDVRAGAVGERRPRGAGRCDR
ncbi:hypothetical protein GCM10009809_40690 [Isoptericola hypogeus]|uniref:Uncharacterized protein n=1 Tax=Isoptericola hypogeus TaxID=300179 RepID=A0ABP4W0D3_9MICO